MKSRLLLLWLLAGPALLAFGRPNIIVFLVDDMGWMDTSVAFGKEVGELNQRYRTPNMERLAAEGMVFTDAYATPVCTPSRVSLMTGINAARHKITNWTALMPDTPTDYDSETTPLRPPVWNYNRLSPDKGVSYSVHATPLPRLLRDAGYMTIHVGKAHFAAAGTPGANPYNLGFLVNVAGNMAGMPQSYYAEENYGNIPGEAGHYAVESMAEYYGTDVHLTEALTREALKTLDDPIKTGRPFFLYFAHYAVHTPIMPDQRFVQNYEGSGLDAGQTAYATMVEGMDKSLGDLMDYLEARGVADNTVLLFMSDNGGQSIAKSKGGELHTHNQPLREGKGSVYEGGIREPMIVKWPGTVKGGSRTPQAVIIEDFFPSVLEIAGIDTRDRVIQPVDGKSFVPVLKRHETIDTDRALLWHFPNKWKKQDHADIDFLSAMRLGDWKIVYRMGTGALELYNLNNDIGEDRDLAGENPDRLESMAETMGSLMRERGALMPVSKATGQPVAWPDKIIHQ